MTSRIFQGGTADWFSSSSWLPAGVPVAGDALTVNTGTVTISATEAANFGSLDNETLSLGGASAAALAADAATFGSQFTIAASSSAGLNFSGSVSFAGTLLAGADTALNISADATGTSEVTLTGGILIGNGDSLFVNGGTLFDDGPITVSNGVLTIGSNTTLQGPGTIEIGANGTVMIDGPVAPGLSIEFTGASGTLMLADPLNFNGIVYNFVKGDVIDLVGAPSYHWVYGHGKLTVLGGNSSQAPEVAKFSLLSNTQLTASQIFVGQDGNGGSEIQLVDVRSWTGNTGDWYTSDNWTTAGTGAVNSYPLFGDSATISAGTAVITSADVTSFGTLNNGRIVLNGNGAGLQIAGDTLGVDLGITAGGSHISNSLVFDGLTRSSATIRATGNGSVLNFIVGNDGTTVGQFVNTGLGTIVAGSEAALNFNGGRVTNDGQIIVKGVMTVGANTTIDGIGVIALNSNSSALTVAGTVAAGQQVAFNDFNNLTVAAGAQFAGTLENFEQGDTVDLAGIVANSASYDTASNLLTLRENGSVVATLSVQGVYGLNDFQVQPDGQGGTDVTTFNPVGGTVYATLPMPALAPSGGTVSLASLLIASFGSNFVAALPDFQLESESPSDLQDFSYWDPNEPKLSYWTVNGTIVAPDNVQPVSAADLDNIDFVAGNEIVASTEVQFPVAFDDVGNATSFLNFFVQNFDSPFAQPSLTSGHPAPQDVVNAASAFASAYTGVPNTEDCWNIASDVAAAAGAAMGRFTASLTPQDNKAAGFWRISYAAAQNGSAISNWSSLVQAGDILRIGWADNGGEHSFTVVSPLDASGSITVFDNVYYATPNGYEGIGIHTAQYWTKTDPNEITIYRLDPNSLYLINNVTADAAAIPGTNFDDLIIPGGSADIMSGAAGNDVFANTSTILNGSTITDFHAGDTIDFTDLSSASTTAGYDASTGMLTLRSSGTQMATVRLPTGLLGTFTITNDGGTAGLDGGTLGVLYDNLYASSSAQGSLVELVTCFAAGTRIATSEGEVAVERLSIGEEVFCHGGKSQRIAWIGHRHLDITRHPAPEKVLPIRVAAGAFGAGLPRRDLMLSPDHAVFVDGALIPIRYLVNGTTVAQMPVSAVPQVSYYHIELPRHDVILAEGLPVESYLDAGNRNRFSNAEGPIVLHPDFSSLIWESEGYAPLRIVGPEVAAVRTRLADIAHKKRRGHTATRRRSSSASLI